ncbi:MAG: DUF1269 domain-containing protein [Actinomycetales bacterium]|nr:DUF1269 domain-containing protein [Actinomycetales bacterium]
MTDITDTDSYGPLGYLVLAVSGDDPAGLSELLELIARDDVRVLDLEAIARDDDGLVHFVDLADVPALAPLAGAYAGLLDQDDVQDVGELLDPGTTAAVIVYEDVWALRLPGFRLLDAGPVLPTDIEAAVASDEI